MDTHNKIRTETPRISLTDSKDPAEVWIDHFSDTDSIDEAAEYDCGQLNLGAESPASTYSDYTGHSNAFTTEWIKHSQSHLLPHTISRRSSWRSLSKARANNTLKKDVADRDCGICFEYTVSPCRTLCCGKLFCHEHIVDWLQGPSSNGRCPSCEQLCSLEYNTISLASPKLPSPISSHRSAAIGQSNPKEKHLVPFPSLETSQGQSRSRSASQTTNSSDSPSSASSLFSHVSSISTSSTLSAGANSEKSTGDDKSALTISPLSTPSYLTPETLEILSRLTSIVGLTLFLYALLA